MSKAQIYTQEPKGAILVAGLSNPDGYRTVSSDTVDYLLSGKNGKKVAMVPHFGLFSEYILPFTTIERGVIKDISYPANDFWCVQDKNGKDVIVFAGIEPDIEHENYAREFAEVAKQFETRMIYVVNSMHQEVPHTREPSVVAYFADPKFSNLQGFTFPSYKGPATAHTLLVVEAKKMGIDALGISVTLPTYIQGDNPKGVNALLRRIAEHSGLAFDFNPLEETTRLFEEEMEQYMQEAPLELREFIRMLEDTYDQHITEEASRHFTLSPSIEGFLRQLGRRNPE